MGTPAARLNVGPVTPKSYEVDQEARRRLPLKLPLAPPTRTCPLMAQCSRRTKRYCGPTMKVYSLMLGLKMLYGLGVGERGSVITAQIPREPQAAPKIVGESTIPGRFVDVLQRAAGTEARVAARRHRPRTCGCTYPGPPLLSLLAACPDPGLSLLGQANLILLWILRLGLRLVLGPGNRCGWNSAL